MSHFKNTGKDYIIDLQDMLDDVPDAKQLYDDELNKAKRFVETLPNGSHNITTDTTTQSYNSKPQNWNWFYAVGGYSAWITGVAEIKQEKSGKRIFMTTR